VLQIVQGRRASRLLRQLRPTLCVLTDACQGPSYAPASARCARSRRPSQCHGLGPLCASQSSATTQLSRAVLDGAPVQCALLLCSGNSSGRRPACSQSSSSCSLSSGQRLAPSCPLSRRHPGLLQCARPRKGLHASARVLDRAWAHPPQALYSATGSISLLCLHPSHSSPKSRSRLHSSACHPVSTTSPLCPVSHRLPDAICSTLVAVSVCQGPCCCCPLCVIAVSHHISPFYPG
jgi:hypothetical protein